MNANYFQIIDEIKYIDSVTTTNCEDSEPCLIIDMSDYPIQNEVHIY